MESVLLIITFIALLALVVFFWLMNKKISRLAENSYSKEMMEVIKLLQLGSKEDRKVLLESLQRNSESLNARLDNAAKVIYGVQKNIGEMSEIGRSMRDLQELLQSPKLRGNIGEQVLKELLSQMLPKQSFHLQYAFRSGEKVDAAIKTSAGIIPIDSKFPMENFRKMNDSSKSKDEQRKAKVQFIKDVKTHILKIAQKYILTEEGTIDYALMYVPSESIYYEIVNSPEIFEFASEKRVLPVSPTTFYAYLRAILMSFEGQKIEAKAQEVLANIRAVQKDYKKVEANLSIMQRHLNNAYNMMGNVYTSFSQLGQKIASTKSLEEDVKNRQDEV